MSTQHARRDGIARDTMVESVMTALSALQSSMSTMQESLGRIEGDLGQVKKDMVMMNDRVERQERRLASIESFPIPPINRPARLYATESHSVSLPRRVPIGYAG